MDMMDFLRGLKGGEGFNPEQLRNFLGGAGPNNSYLDLGPYSAYLRRSTRLLPQGDHTRIRDRASMKALDLANIGRLDNGGAMDVLPPEQRQGKGKFRALMALLEQEAAAKGYKALYTENIMNAFLPDVLKSMGYNRDLLANMGDPRLPSMYKYLGQRDLSNLGGGQL